MTLRVRAVLVKTKINNYICKENIIVTYVCLKLDKIKLALSNYLYYVK